MIRKTVKFYGKSVDAPKFAKFEYIGSTMADTTTRDTLIRSGEAIGGPVYGPMICMIEGEFDVIVLKI